MAESEDAALAQLTVTFLSVVDRGTGALRRALCRAQAL